jgi:hypothetical protein
MQRLGFAAKFPQQECQRIPLLPFESREDAFHVALVLCKYLANQFSSLFSQVHDASPAICGIRAAFYQPVLFQAIHCRGHRTAADQNLLAEGAHRERAFVKERFQNSEVASPKACPFHASSGMNFYRFASLPQQEPQVSSIGPKILFVWHLHFSLYRDALCRVKFQLSSQAFLRV